MSWLADVERSTGVTFRWRPFHLVILQKMKHVPFADKPTKSAYMWRGRPSDWQSEIDGLARTFRNRLPSGRYSPLHAAGAYQLRKRGKTTISSAGTEMIDDTMKPGGIAGPQRLVRNHQSAQATMRISDSSNSRIRCPHKITLLSGY